MRSYAQLLDAALGQYQLTVAANTPIADCRHHAPTSIAPRFDGYHWLFVQRSCETSICVFPLDRRLLTLRSPRSTHATTGSECTRLDTALPHPFLMSFRSDRLLKTFGNRRELKGSTRFAARNRKKPRQHWTFRSAGTNGARSAATGADKLLTQCDDSHFCHMRQQPICHVSNCAPRANKIGHGRNRADSKSNRSVCRNKSFIGHQFFCAVFWGNRRSA